MSTGCIPVGFILNGTYGSTSGKDAPTLGQGEVMLGRFSHILYKHWSRIYGTVFRNNQETNKVFIQMCKETLARNLNTAV